MKHVRTAVLAAGLTLAATGSVLAWGYAGHSMIARVAAEALPSGMPAFFTGAVDQLVYLNYEPDRWKDGELAAMADGFRFDHYIDLENVPAGALDAVHRFDYLEALYEAGLESPHQQAGLLPYRILELYQRLMTGFARWRLAGMVAERDWLEQRVLNDAGILGHYVADAAQPHHVTIHFNGWAPDAPNPEGYTTSREFHWQFESRFVEAHVTTAELREAVPPGVTPIDDVRAAVMDYIRATHDQVVPLYEVEKRHGFDPEAPPAPAAEAFALDRLAAGTVMLRSLWYSAWRESGAYARSLEDEGPEAGSP